MNKRIYSHRLWRGVAAAICVFFSVATFMAALAYERQGDINKVLKVKVPSQTVTADTNYYPASFSTRESLNEAVSAYNIQAQTEGSVLVKNADNALPLKAGERGVTLFGNAAANPVFKPNCGGPANSGVSLYDALKTAGFSINDTVYNALKASGIKTDVKGKIAEVPVSFYSDSLQSSYASSYNDIAIVMFSRFGGEESDLAVNDPDGIPQLSFHSQEADVLKMIKDSGKFGKTVVLINSGFAMDLEWLEDPQYGVDACLWVGFPGGNGFIGVTNILAGAADPSGSFGDTYAANSLSAPAMQNFGDFTFYGLTDVYKNKYLVYAEGIYVGYKYYETRYQDQVLGINNANGSKGAFRDTAWDYAKETAYPFGYGNSYAEFTREVESIEWDKAAHTVTAVVKVTNGGAPAGSAYTGKSKAAVQLYVQLPYEAGQAEKSAIQLVDFGKTKELAKGETDTVTIVADDYLFTTYDRDAANGADAAKKGCYVFDAGDYYFAVGDDCHDALNNVLAARNVSGMFAPDGAPAAGDAGNAVKVPLAALDNTSYARSRETGEIVCNQFDDADLNYFIQGKVEYLTRGDWDTYPEAVVSVSPTDEMKAQMNSRVYAKPTDAPQVESFKRDVKNDIKLVEMRGVGYDDPLWDDFIDQLSISSLCQLPGEKAGNDAIPEVGYPANLNGDGPEGLESGTLLVAEVVAANSMNKDLLAERGDLMAEEARFAGWGGVYAPGANLHRTAYGGRNGEYYSEDSALTYHCGAAQAGAMTKKGVVATVKHFAGNDQETNRHGVATFMTEQALRENSLRAFEGAFTVGKTLGTMTAYSRIGCVPTAASRPLITHVLRNEWGFKGLCITDWSKDTTTYMYTAECVAAGTDQFGNDAGRSTEVRKLLVNDKDGYLWQKSREAAKHILYAYSRSHIINGLTPDTVVKDFVPWWQKAIIAVEVVVGAVALASIGMFVYTAYFRKKKGKLGGQNDVQV